VYSVGGGNDQINNYDGRTDKIVLQGLDSSINTITGSGSKVKYEDKGSSFVLTFTDSNNKKNTLTINSPLSKVNVYKEGSDDALLSYGVELPDYTGYNKNRTAVTLGASVSDSAEAQAALISIDLDGQGYSANIKEIDASAFVGTVNLVGNAKADALKSAIGGGTLEGGYDAANKKATADKLYGSSGSDTFVYRLVKGIGGGSDVIGGDAKYSLGNYQEHDAIYITSGTGLSKADLTITDKSGALTVKFKGDSKSQLTINKASDSTPVTFYLGSSDTALEDITDSFTYGVMPDGARFGTKKDKTDYTTLVLTSTLEADNNIDVSNINSQIKTIDSTKATVPTYVVGNANANAVSLGAYGGTVDGGAGNDKIFGNSATTASTTFVYTLGDGNDEINFFDGTKDIISISGYTKAINTSDKSVFKDSGKDITLTLSSGTTKGKLTIKNVTGELKIVGEDANGDALTLLEYGKNLPDAAHMTYNAGKTAMTIGSAAELDGVDTFKLSDYGVNLKEIDASHYSSTGLHLIAADGKANILRAGSASSTLEGGTGKDKLYGSTGADSFVYSVKTGSGDEIYSLDGSQGDEIILLGYSKDTINTADKQQFADNGKDINLIFDGTKLVLKNPTGQLNVYKGSLDADGNIVKGDAVLSYDKSLPDGLSYNVGKTTLTFNSTIEGGTGDYTVDASVKNAYSVKLTTINASLYGGAVELVGNDASNVIYSGKSGGTLNGGAGADKLYGGAGNDTFVYNNDGSKDIVYNFDAAMDVIKVDEPKKAGGLVATYNGKTLVLTYTDKNGSLTINGKETEKKNKYAELDTSTTISIQIGDDDVHTYQFVDTKMKNVALSDKIDSKYAIVDGGTQSDGGDDGGDTETTTETTSSQLNGLVTEPYWFEESTDVSAANSELDEIIDVATPTEFVADDADFNELKKKFDHALVANSGARHQSKK
ncbi:MAG: hypothetical protein IJU71_10100, partial [Selenomonadaceae bacterium]|nr:hypothetical protein [Selenomonadaceae bacterium]